MVSGGGGAGVSFGVCLGFTTFWWCVEEIFILENWV